MSNISRVIKTILRLKDEMSESLLKNSKATLKLKEQVEKARDQVKKFQVVNVKATAGLKEQQAKVKSLTSVQNKNNKTIVKTKADIEKYKNMTGLTTKQIEKNNKKILEAKRKFDELSKAQHETTSSLQNANNRIKSYNTSIKANNKAISYANKRITKYTKKIKKNTATQKKAQSAVNRWGKGAIKSIDKVIKRTVQLGAAIIALSGALIIKSGFTGLKSLDEGARKVKTIAGESLTLKKIQEDILKVSKKTGISFEEIAETQYNAISAGVKASESIKATVLASKLSKAGFTDANSALKVMTSTMNVYGLSGQKAMAGISDKLMATQNLGVTTVAELSSSIGGLTPIAQKAGVSIDELFSGMASLTKNGLKTEAATASYKGVLSSLIKPSAEAARTAKELGIDFSVAGLKSKGLSKFLIELREKTGGSTETMAKLFGGVEALSGALILTGGGLKDFDVAMVGMKNSTGKTDEAFKIMSNSIGERISRLGNTLTTLTTRLLKTQSDAINSLIGGIEQWIDKNEKNIKVFINNFANGISSLMKTIKSLYEFFKKYRHYIEGLGIIIGVIYTIVKAFEALKYIMIGINIVAGLINGTLATSPLGIIAITIGLVVGALYLLWRNMDSIIAIFKSAWEWVKTLGNTFVDFAKNAIDKVVSSFSNLFDWLKNLGEAFLEFVTGIPLIGDVFTTYINVFKTIIDVAQNLFGWLKKIFGFDSEKKINITLNKRENSELGLKNRNQGSQMEQYANGGIATKASIFGEAGAEIAIPLNNSSRSKNLLTQANNIIGSGGSSKSESKGVTINLYGDFYGFEDFKEKIAKSFYEIIRDNNPNVVV